MIRWSVLIFLLQIALVIKTERDGALSIVKDDVKEELIEETADDDLENEDDTPFIPSKNWQKIKPGQTIPSGLHVRINLQTGEKEAKLLNDKDSVSGENINNKFAYYKVKDEKLAAVLQSKQLEELKHMLKSLKSDYKETSEEDAKTQNVEKIRAKFRNIEELKKEFAKVNLAIKTDSEMLMELMKEYPKVSNERKITILKDVEYLVHQYDAAQMFVKFKGLQLILPDLNSTNSKLRSYVAFTIGSAMQGNPPVQIAVYETNILQQLLRILIYDVTDEVQSRVLYALSCLLRQFPLAQQHFTDSGGLIALAELFKQTKLHSSKLQLKAVTLLHDLVIEQQQAKQYASNDKQQKEKLQQYNNFNLQTGLIQHGFCDLIPKLLLSPDYDTQEKVLNAMVTIVHLCKHQFKEHLEILKSLSNSYQELSLEEKKSSEESDDLYFSSLYDLVQNLLTNIGKKDEL
ncbi:nucleotide exchange factor SIL1-like [Centruroides sculpturatus]|uniref:nucleotide exchange factor SIL1-like n=1 Tax=Centruroides sculpturatus TaxID=218467 RepID=UPI000C6D7A98|nr:nucleotide exchange factor SIL1-like [Centruroides sculpturatus]